MRAYYMDSSAEDQRAPHEQDPPAPCSLEALAAIGVLYWRLDAAVARGDERAVEERAAFLEGGADAEEDDGSVFGEEPD